MTAKKGESIKEGVEINGVVYTLNSSNVGLLKQLEGGKKKDESGKWVEQKFDYLPMNMVYRLMDGLFLSYDIISHPAVSTGETYNVKKFDYASKTEIADEAKVMTKEVTIIINSLDGSHTKVVGYAEGVAGIGILSKDNARNGFIRKLTARARKEALANLGQVFRIDSEFIEDQEEQRAVKEEETVTGVASAKEAVASFVNVSDRIEELKMMLGEKLIGKENVDKNMLIAALKEIKRDLKIKEGGDDHKILKTLLEDFSAQITK